MQIQFVGAAGTVTGSKYIVTVGERKILIDCGMYQGLKELRLRNWAAPPFDASTIDAVVLTHAHMDHAGWLPVLMRWGFRGPVLCTEGTREVCGILLPDSGRIQEADAEYANRKGFSKHTPALPLYTEADAHLALQRFRPQPWHQRIDLGGGVHCTFIPVGHILGAAMVLVDDGTRSVLFSGDVGRPHDSIMRDAEAPPAATVLVVESTYGNRRHQPSDPETTLAEVIRRTAHRGGAVIVPSFCVGRAQELLHLLSELKARDAIPDLPIYLDSPMAIDATELYWRFRAEHRLTTEAAQAMCRVATLVRTAEESKRISAWQGPMIVIAGSGMATGGRVLHHIKAFAPDVRNTILFAGYQAPGTRGADIVRGVPEVKLHGRMVPIRAEVARLENLSAHADADELLAWMQRMPAPPQQVYVTHGEPDAATAFCQRIGSELGWAANSPAYLDVVDVPADTRPMATAPDLPNVPSALP